MKSILGALYGARYLILALAILVVFCLPQIVQAAPPYGLPNDPPRARYAYTLRLHTRCLVSGDGGGYTFIILKVYTTLRITGTSASGYWRMTNYNGVPLLCPSTALSRLFYGGR